MSIEGHPKFNTLALATVSVNFLKPTLELKAVAAFTDSESGHTHGWTRGDGGVWSKETLKKLQELKLSMEQDLAALHFEGATKPGSTTASQKGLGFSGGLLEHLGEEAPSV